MKNLALFLLVATTFFFTNLSANNSADLSTEEMTCVWDSWFKYPHNNGQYQQGKDVYVRVDPKIKHHIAYMELFVNGKYVRKESSYPFEWAKQGSNGDHYLRNLKPGTYKLKVKVKDKCGSYHEQHRTFYVKGHNPHPNPNNCIWDSWFKYPQNNASYQPGKSVYVRVDPKKYQDIAQMELYVNGKFVRKETSYPYEWAKGNGNSDSYLRNLKPGTYKLTVKIKDKCGKYHEKHCIIHVKHHNNPNPGHCEWESWFKYPQNNASYQPGKSVYVRVDPKKYQDIEYMELYVNGKFVRKETSHPYEWAKQGTSGDNYLRNMQPGTYKLTVKIKDKCGKYHEKHCVIYVKHQNNPNPGGHCEWDSWFKYPKNNASYQPGKAVYVRVDPKKYQDIEYMELYVNGKFVRKETSYPYEWCKGNGNSDSYLRNLKPGTYKLTVKIKDKCGKYHEKHCVIYVKHQNNPNPGHCEWNAWFKYPKNNSTFKYGSNVYVRVDPKKYQDIAYMELYVNGKFVRKETSYPYEWCKGNGNSDSYLRRLKRGTYKIKVRVTDKCGQYHDNYCTFYVK